MAPINPPKMTADVTTSRSIIPEPTVLATAVPKPNAARKLNAAAQTTACPGVRTRVATMVAIEFTASWKPLMKSKIKATAMSAIAAKRTVSIGLRVLVDDAFEEVAHVFAPVRGRLEKVENLLPLDDGNRIAL